MVHSSLITQILFPPRTNDRPTKRRKCAVVFLSSASLKSSSAQLWLPWSSHISPCLVKSLMGSQLNRGPTSLLSILTTGDLAHITSHEEKTTLERGNSRPGGKNHLPKLLHQASKLQPPPSSKKPAGPLHWEAGTRKGAAGRRAPDSVSSVVKQPLFTTS